MEQGKRADATLSGKLEERVRAVRLHCRNILNSHPEAIIADYRYGYIASVLKQGVLSRDERSARIAFSEKADRLLTQRLLGPAIMLAVLYGVFYVTFTVGEIPMGWLEALVPEGLLRSLLVSGVIDGVGGVLGFVPLIMVMFLALTLLEQTGYMARVAYMLDRVFRMFGLHGCSVMPFLISGGLPGGCAVPGIMATRTLRSPKEKLATLLTAPFMTCGAKVPVFILLAAAFFQGMEAQAALRNSLAGRVGVFLEPVSRWAGFDWRTNIALVGGFAAKEVVVSTLGTAYSLGEVDPEEPEALSEKLADDPGWSVPVALSLMVFVLLYAPCFVTVVAMARESSWKWALFSTCFSTVLAFSLAAGVYRVSSLLA